MFISSRPADKVSNEVSIIIGYPFKPNSEATVEVGSTSFALYTQQDGAWIKNAAEEAHMIEAMRAGQSAVVKGMSAKGTHSTDTFSLKGLCPGPRPHRPGLQVDGTAENGLRPLSAPMPRSASIGKRTFRPIYAEAR